MTTEGLKVGEVIKADIIGLGFYRIESFGETFVNVELLKLFCTKGNKWRGHITNCHNYPHPIDLKRWLSYPRYQMKSYIASKTENK